MISSQRAEDVNEESLVQYYADEWVRYKAGASLCNRLFNHFNRQVAYQHRQGKKDESLVYPVRGL